MAKESDEYYLKLAETVSAASTCIWCRCGVVLVDEDGEVISTGYSHGLGNLVNCRRDGACSWQQEHGKLPHLGKQAECNSLHAEIYAILSAERERVKGSTIYIFGYDCVAKKAKAIVPDHIVSRVLQAAGVKNIITIVGEEYPVLGNYYETVIDDHAVKELIAKARR